MSSECQVNVSSMLGECQVNVNYLNLSLTLVDVKLVNVYFMESDSHFYLLFRRLTTVHKIQWHGII